MARVNVEERAFARAYELAGMMTWDVKTAIGSMVMLWHDSQDKLRTDGTAREIVRWARVALQESELFISALLEVDFIRPIDDERAADGATLYRIAGNEEQLQWVNSHRERARKGGAATRLKWERERDKKSGNASSLAAALAPALASATADALAPARADARALARANAMQCNSMQDNAMQCNAEKASKSVSGASNFSGREQPEVEGQILIPGVASAPVPQETNGKGSRSDDQGSDKGKGASAKSTPVWEAYKRSYSNRYRDPSGDPIEPIRNREANIACCQLIDKLGLELAIQVAEFYVHHNDSFFVRCGHALPVAVVNAQKLATELRSGRTITSTTARQVERRENNRQVWSKMLSKEDDV